MLRGSSRPGPTESPSTLMTISTQPSSWATVFESSARPANCFSNGVELGTDSSMLQPALRSVPRATYSSPKAVAIVCKSSLQTESGWQRCDHSAAAKVSSNRQWSWRSATMGSYTSRTGAAAEFPCPRPKENLSIHWLSGASHLENCRIQLVSRSCPAEHRRKGDGSWQTDGEGPDQAPR
jgi:hypothetical protein